MPHANPLTKLQNTIFSPKIFSQQFIDKLKFEEMEYIIYVWNVNSLTLLSYRLDFKLKHIFGHNFSQFIHKFGFLRFWDFWMLLWLGFSNFPYLWKRSKIGFFNISLGCSQILPSSLKEIGIFEDSLNYTFNQIMR